MRHKARAIARRLGFGKAILKLSQQKQLGIRKTIELHRMKRKFLPLIANAKPISAGAGDVEVHMLLHQQALYEGMWAFYSFAYFASQPCRFIVHDDGSLTSSAAMLLNKIFPQCQVISRQDADSTVMSYFDSQGLKLCARLRQNLIFGLKLFDLSFFARSSNFVLLDSDVLFFSRPETILKYFVVKNNGDSTQPRYSVDNGYRYCLSEADLTRMLGRKPIERFNPGVLCVGRNSVDFTRIENYLAHPKFWRKNGAPDYFAELTLWAMELTKSGALPLPENYAIAPSEIKDPGLVSGHFCGGIESAYLYYTRALPHLAAVTAM